jgi:hypothetical protein
LDKIRGEDYRKLFPELVRLRDATKGWCF